MSNDNEGILEMLDYLLMELPDSEFIESLSDQYDKSGHLSTKQYDALCNLYWQWGGK